MKLPAVKNAVGEERPPSQGGNHNTTLASTIVTQGNRVTAVLTTNPVTSMDLSSGVRITGTNACF